MSTYDLTGVVPFEVLHTGVFLKSKLQARKITQCKLAEATGILVSIINAIIRGRRDRSAKYSILIGKALGLAGDFFLSLQARYDINRAKKSLA